MENNRRNDVGSKIIIGILISTVTILLGIFLSTSMKSAEMSRAQANEAKVMAYENKEKISILNTQYIAIRQDLQEIKSLLK